MSEHPMMTCGHAANGFHHVRENGAHVRDEPACVICDCFTIAPEPPSLEGRTARCHYYGKPTHKNECRKCTRGGTCSCELPSSTSLAFFRHKSDQPFDEFYCGCWGWD